MDSWLEDELNSIDDHEHRWLSNDELSISYSSLYCPWRDSPIGFGSERDFNFCPHCGEDLNGSN